MEKDNNKYPWQELQPFSELNNKQPINDLQIQQPGPNAPSTNATSIANDIAKECGECDMMKLLIPHTYNENRILLLKELLERAVRSNKKIIARTALDFIQTYSKSYLHYPLRLQFKSKIEQFTYFVGDIFIDVVDKNNLEFLKLFCQAGINTNYVPADGKPALMRSSRANNIEAIKLLLEHKADPNQKNKEKITSLMVAAQFGYSPAVELMINNAQYSLTVDNISKAYEIAKMKNHHTIINLLEKKKASFASKKWYEDFYDYFGN